MNTATSLTPMRRARTLIKPINYQKEILQSMIDHHEVVCHTSHTTPRTFAADQRSLRENPPTMVGLRTSLADQLTEALKNGGVR